VKLYAECIACQVQVRLRDINTFLGDEDARVEAMKKIVNSLNDVISKCGSRYDIQCNPTLIASKLFRQVKDMLGDSDPYKQYKVQANREALKYYRELKEILSTIEDARDRLRFAIKVSLIGNLLDVGVAGYSSPDVSQLVNMVNTLEILGDVERCIDMLLKSRSVAILLDNAGEAVFDRILADVLRSKGKKVVGVVKGGAFQNDIAVNDVFEAGLNESFDEIVDTGSDASSIIIHEARKETLDLLRRVDIIVSKGMANYEYLSEIEHFFGKPVIYMLIAKCSPVARDIGVPRGKAAIRISIPRGLHSFL